MAVAILFSLAVVSPVRADTGGAGQVTKQPSGKTPFDRQGMWIWYVSASEGGDPAAILARAKRSGIGTVYVKAGDGDEVWSQFNRTLVRRLHAGGLKVCAWQYVYGDQPVDEAKVGAIAVNRGADCLVIDAEAEYEGKYASADRYIRTLRPAIGPRFPLSLAAFPYVDYHPSFPYSVFLGPDGATYNQPQMYWRAIETSVRAVYEHTYLHNRIWGHPVYPIGQTYEGPSSAELRLFRRYAQSFEGRVPSWWSWQETSGAEWGALGADNTLRPVDGYSPPVEHPLLKRGSRGDMVVWAQQHLIGAGLSQVPISGVFGRTTIAAVRSFQAERGLPVDGRIGTETWNLLLQVEPYRMNWAGDGDAGAAGGAASGATAPAEAGGAASTLEGGAHVARPRGPRRPLSASLPALAYEIPPGPAR